VDDRAVEPQGDALPGQRQARADDVVAEADVAGSVHGPVDLGHVPGCRGQRRRPGGLGSGGGEAGQVAGVEPGRQGLDAVAVEQDVDLVKPGPEPDGAAGHRRAEPDLLPGDPEVARRRDRPVQFHGPALAVAGNAGGQDGCPVVGNGVRFRNNGCRQPGQLGRHPQADRVARGRGEPGCREGHGQGLVRAPGVVVLAPGIDRGLRVLDAGERAAGVEQFQLERLVQPLDLPRGSGRPRLGQPLGDSRDPDA
jgi:hypothetical protein